MIRQSFVRPSPLATAALVLALVAATITPASVAAQGVGHASWTPSSSMTEATTSTFLSPGDSITYETRASWSHRQVSGLRSYVEQGLRYTHEVNDRSGRLHATGYWATNHPDPAYDRDDDDGDGRWEEAEITIGEALPVPGETYRSLIQFSRWHPKRERGTCVWAWDRRRGGTEVLSQLSRDYLGEWQAERYTLAYQNEPYPRVGTRPRLPDDAPRPRCREPQARPGQSGIVVTFARPISWHDFASWQQDGVGRWTAWEAIGSSGDDRLTWTCGGPNISGLALEPCRSMGVRPDGVTAAVGYYSEDGVAALRANADVALVEALRDPVTDLLFDVGGFGVELPGLTVNDAYWDLFLAD